MEKSPGWVWNPVDLCPVLMDRTNLSSVVSGSNQSLFRPAISVRAVVVALRNRKKEALDMPLLTEPDSSLPLCATFRQAFTARSGIFPLSS
jgi:hypothetical protein